MNVKKCVICKNSLDLNLNKGEFCECKTCGTKIGKSFSYYIETYKYISLKEILLWKKCISINNKIYLDILLEKRNDNTVTNKFVSLNKFTDYYNMPTPVEFEKKLNNYAFIHTCLLENLNYYGTRSQPSYGYRDSSRYDKVILNYLVKQLNFLFEKNTVLLDLYNKSNSFYDNHCYGVGRILNLSGYKKGGLPTLKHYAAWCFECKNYCLSFEVERFWYKTYKMKYNFFGTKKYVSINVGYDEKKAIMLGQNIWDDVINCYKKDYLELFPLFKELFNLWQQLYKIISQCEKFFYIPSKYLDNFSLDNLVSFFVEGRVQYITDGFLLYDRINESNASELKHKSKESLEAIKYYVDKELKKLFDKGLDTSNSLFEYDEKLIEIEEELDLLKQKFNNNNLYNFLKNQKNNSK